MKIEAAARPAHGPRAVGLLRAGFRLLVLLAIAADALLIITALAAERPIAEAGGPHRSRSLIDS